MENDIFKDIIGYDDIKKTIERIIDVLNNKNKYRLLGSTMPHGLLLYGKPGTGKTSFANAILDNVNRYKFIIRKNASDGRFVHYIKNIFEEAKKKQPSIILLDDIDKYAKAERYCDNQEEFVVIQGFLDDIKNEDIFVIATANDRSLLPESLRRSGRLDIKIETNNPCEKDSLKIIEHLLKRKKIDKNVNVKNIANILRGTSCADLEKVCNQAGLYAGFKNKKHIGMDELIRASLEHQYGTNIEDEDKENEYSLETAYHEAGHALIANLLSPGIVSFMTIARTSSDTKGITIFHENEYYLDNVDFMKNRIKANLAGKAATEIVFKKCDTGANDDIRQSYGIAQRMIDNYCMNDFNSWVEDHREVSESVKESKCKNISNMLNDYYKEVKELLIANRKKLDLLANTLNEKKILFEDEINEIINSVVD